MLIIYHVGCKQEGPTATSSLRPEMVPEYRGHHQDINTLYTCPKCGEKVLAIANTTDGRIDAIGKPYPR